MKDKKTNTITEQKATEPKFAAQKAEPKPTEELQTKHQTQPPTQPEKNNQESAELKELLQRTQANFENYRKQQEKRIEEIRAFAAKDIILQLLPILDNLALALKNTNCHPAEFIKGIELIYSQLFDILENNGVKPILTEKQTFDPCYHEALMRVESELPVNTIVEEWQEGFTLHNKVIRHAKVKISLGKKEVSEKKQSQ